MKRTATCSCGQLKILVEGDPAFVLTCSCLQCQKRTGSVYGVSAYFTNDQVIEQSGESSSYEKTSDSGSASERYFCPNCGSSVYWKGKVLDNFTGIAVGAFADPQFPEPIASFWNISKHEWVSFPEHWANSDEQELAATVLDL